MDIHLEIAISHTLFKATGGFGESLSSILVW